MFVLSIQCQIKVIQASFVIVSSVWKTCAFVNNHHHGRRLQARMLSKSHGRNSARCSTSNYGLIADIFYNNLEVSGSRVRLFGVRTNDDEHLVDADEDGDDDEPTLLSLNDDSYELASTSNVEEEKQPAPYGKGSIHISRRNGKNRDYGLKDNFSIVEHFEVPADGLKSNSIFQSMLTGKSKRSESNVTTDPNNNDTYNNVRVDVLSLKYDNVTLPTTLYSLYPTKYPSLSRARKACRKGSILIHRGPLTIDPVTNEPYFDSEKCMRGRAGDRVYPLDVIAIQVRMGGAFYPGMTYSKPPFEVPVVYEDDHFAIVNKPAGVVTYNHRNGGHSRMALRAALPFVLKPPSNGTTAILRKPAPVHRLDKPTSGLLLVAKTKPAMVNLSRQFVERKIKKTYTAIVNGIPDEPRETSISGATAKEMGVHINRDGDDTNWQLIDYTLDEKHAITIWRALQYAQSLRADQGILTMVELKPKTGRFHQLRRHLAWVCDRPIIGDKTYDNASESALHFRAKGLYLCSNQVILEHPFYNTEIGRKVWDEMTARNINEVREEDSNFIGNTTVRLSEDGSTVEVHASIETPLKFKNLLRWEEDRATRLGEINK